MKKSRITILSLLLLVCFIVPAAAQEPVFAQNTDTVTNNTDAININIDGSAVEIPVYQSEPNGAEPQSVVRVGTVYFHITRLQPNGTKCALDLQYVASAPQYAASSIKLSSLKIGTGLDFDKYGSQGASTHFFRRATTNGFITDIAFPIIPTNVTSVAVRATGLQAYVNGVYSLAQLSGQMVTVKNP